MTDVRTPEAGQRQRLGRAGHVPGGPRRAETPPARPGTGSFGVLAWARWGWRQLTSMRIALVLLFLLALGSVPGSLLPQQGIDPAAVQQYYTAHPALAPVPQRARPVQRVRRSLVRGDLPAAVHLAGRLRAAADVPAGPVGPGAAAAAPRHLSRLPNSVRYETAMTAGEASAAAATFLAPAALPAEPGTTAGCRRRRGTAGKSATCCSTSP